MTVCIYLFLSVEQVSLAILRLIFSYFYPSDYGGSYTGVVYSGVASVVLN